MKKIAKKLAIGRPALGDRMIASLNQAIAFANGDDSQVVVRVPHAIDTKRMRKESGMTQQQFADTYGFSVGAVRDWEQGRIVPDLATRNYLAVIGRAPKVVEAVIDNKPMSKTYTMGDVICPADVCTAKAAVFGGKIGEPVTQKRTVKKIERNGPPKATRKTVAAKMGMVKGGAKSTGRRTTKA